MARIFRLSTALWGGAVIFVLVALFGFNDIFRDANAGDELQLAATEGKSSGPSQGLRRIALKPTLENSVAAAGQQGQSTKVKSQEVKSSAEHLARELEQASGRALQALLRQFWQVCRFKDNCREQLARLQQVLDPGYYSLLENFAAREQQREQLLGDELIAHDSDLEEKIARVKAVNEQVWGDDAGLLYRDEYALYDFSLQGKELAQLTGVDEFIDGYRQLTQGWQGKLASLDLQTPEARYEQALSLLPASFSESQRARARAELAHLYLSQEQAAAIDQREQQVAEQANTVASYQQGLAALNRELAQQRATSLAHLSVSEWQNYQSQQIYQYRLDFFGN
ncbi:chromosome segregation ATPase [Thalassomonas viridans]|uniref:Chromosome segregation ATPase n=1 Tax=Thalassomonas viridans TaxID=137584 RepID=A0AAF0C7U8_9GAMM|nr:hypothetical protein [Thalassomonas viridans]WDE03721.1 chromosome segregation ATPase [Thalassomonas viridans]